MMRSARLNLLFFQDDVSSATLHRLRVDFLMGRVFLTSRLCKALPSPTLPFLPVSVPWLCIFHAELFLFFVVIMNSDQKPSMELRDMGGTQMNDENDMARLGKVQVLKVCGSRSFSNPDIFSI